MLKKTKVGKPVPEVRIVIRGGVASVVSKSAGVRLVITDYDNVPETNDEYKATEVVK